MSVPAEVSYFSRFLVKFIEMIAAGLATAMCGYLIAHLNGAVSSPAPTPASAVNQVPPSTSMLSSLPLQPNPPVSFDTNKLPPAPRQEINAPPVAQPRQPTADIIKVEPPRKRVENATTAAESNHHRVRAALANVDAKRTDDPLEGGAPRPAEVTRRSPVMAQPRPITAPPAITTPPITATAASPLIPGEARSAPTPGLHPVDPTSLPTVEVTSRPVAEAPASTEKDTGTLSTLGQMLRQDPLNGTVDPPRPPMPVPQ